MALQTRRVLPVSDEPAPVMFLTHCHHTFKKTYRDHASLSTALQSDLLFLQHGKESRDWTTRQGLKNQCRDSLHGPTWRPGSVTVAGGPLPCHLPSLLPPDLHQMPPNLQQPSQHMQGTTPTGCRRSPLHSRHPQNPHPESGPGGISNNDTRDWSAISVHPKSWCSVGNAGANKNSKRSSK